MKTKTILVCGLLVAIFALAFIACDDGSDHGSGNTPTNGPGITLPELTGTITITDTLEMIAEMGMTMVGDEDAGYPNELTATYTGPESVSYQWYKDGTAIPNATSNKYTPTVEGIYTITLSATGYRSKGAMAIVVDPSSPPLSGTVSISPNTDVTIGTQLTATYTGNEAVTYQWLRDGTPVGTNSNKYTPSEPGEYMVIVVAAGYIPEFAFVIVTDPNALGNPTPADYDIGNLDQDAGFVTAVTITPKAGKSSGMVTVLYNGSTTIPQSAGTYTVTFNVAAAYGWKAANGLSAGTLTVTVLPQYTITGSGTSFTATKDGATVGTASQPIQTVINAIRTDAAGVNISIKFGDGTTALNIGTVSAEFSGTGWGKINLTGKITSAVTDVDKGTILVGGAVSINSTADITNTFDGTNLQGGNAIRQSGTGTVEILGGTVSAQFFAADVAGSLKISGGTVKLDPNTNGSPANPANDNSPTLVIRSAVIARSSATIVTISGGTVVGQGSGVAVQNFSGTVTISGGSVQGGRSPGSLVNSYAVKNNNGTVIITGGVVYAENSVASVYNNGTGTVTLGGSPTITTQIYHSAAGGTLKLNDDFAPYTDRTYWLEYATLTAGRIAVTGGAPFASYFKLTNAGARTLVVNGNDLVISN
jgi:hypothetical protein